MTDGTKDSLLAELEAGARRLHEKTGSQLCGEMSCHVTVGPHGHLAVKYWARAGESYGPLSEMHVFETGPTATAALECAVNACDKKSISKKIRVHFLEKMAEELGFEVSEKKAKR